MSDHMFEANSNLGTCNPNALLKKKKIAVQGPKACQGDNAKEDVHWTFHLHLQFCKWLDAFIVSQGAHLNSVKHVGAAMS